MDRWGTICRDGWDLNEAKVVCREKFGEDALAEFETTSDQLPNEKPFMISHLKCNGNESSLLDCQFTLLRDFHCTSTTPASLFCLSSK